MAVVTLKSTQITNRDAVPAVKSNGVQDANIMHARGVVVGGAADSIGSKYLFCSVPSNARIISARLTTTGTGTVGTTDLGVYKSTADGGAVVNAGLFASAQALTVALEKKELLFESGVITKANSEKALWEHLGLAADPKLVYDVVATLTAAVDAAHDLLLEIDYTQ